MPRASSSWRRRRAEMMQTRPTTATKTREGDGPVPARRVGDRRAGCGRAVRARRCPRRVAGDDPRRRAGRRDLTARGRPALQRAGVPHRGLSGGARRPSRRRLWRGPRRRRVRRDRAASGPRRRHVHDHVAGDLGRLTPHLRRLRVPCRRPVRGWRGGDRRGGRRGRMGAPLRRLGTERDRLRRGPDRGRWLVGGTGAHRHPGRRPVAVAARPGHGAGGGGHRRRPAAPHRRASAEGSTPCGTTTSSPSRCAGRSVWLPP